MHYMNKQERQRKLTEIIRTKEVVNQDQLQKELKRLGVVATQSSISRDLAELGVVKLKGAYRLPHLDPGESTLVDLLDMESAGENLLVLKTPPGQAQIVAITIDRARLPEVVGTVAGDDTIFVAVKNPVDQGKATKQILNLFKNTSGRNEG